MRKIIPLMGILLFGCYACSDGNNVKSEEQDIRVENDLIVVRENAPVMDKIKIEKVEKSPFQVKFSTSGVVKAIPTAYAEIATPFAGRIVRSFVRLGQSVTQGSPLFEISSPAFFETSKSYFSAKQEMEQAFNNLNREKDLLANKVGVTKNVEEAQVSYALKKQDYENAKSSLRVFQVDPEKIVLGAPLIVRSPIAGKVVTNNIIIGQYIKEDSSPLAVIADLNKVWVIAHVMEKDIPLIEGLQEVSISLSATPKEFFKGKIYHISDMLEEETRSVEVIIECDNRMGKMKPFMYGTVVLTDAQKDVILIPTSAILQQEENCYVLVRVGDRKFRKAQVEVTSTEGDKSVIAVGLQPGEKIVTEGAFYLLDAK